MSSAEQLDSERLHAEARVRTGLADFGPGTYHEALEVLLDSARRESRMHEVGWRLFEEQLTTHLVNRLEIQAWTTRHPEIRDVEIRAPVFVVGLPRTGTTMLTFLLQQDPANRLLLTWEARRPCPPPEPATHATDPRIAEVRELLQREWFDTVPNFRSIHLMEVDGPDECVHLLGNDLTSTHFLNMMNVPGYYAWLRGHADYLPTYRYHALQLKLLSWKMRPRRWVLKFASHLLALEAIERVYPDATLVFTHRDPVRLLASLSNLTTEFRRPRSDDVDPVEVGTQLLDYLEDCIHTLMEYRAHSPRLHCVDVDYRGLVDDPLPAFRRLYEEIGVALGPAAEANVRRWLAENPPHKHGRHVYDLATFGIDRERASAAFADYRERFGIPDEELDA